MNRNTIETAALTSIARVCESLSFDACRHVGAWLGLGIYAALGRRRGVSVGNVRLALGVSKARANQISRRAVMNFGMTLTEFMHLRVATPAEVRAYSWIEGLEHIESGFAAGQGVILLTGHLGNWEVMGARAAQEFPLTVVARPTGNAGVQAHIDAVRAAGGLGVISKYDNGRASLRVLKNNESLGILPDQHAGAEGLSLPMFGQPTQVWGAIARLAMLSGARVVPAFGVRKMPFLADGRIVATVSQGWNVPKSGDRNAAVMQGTRQTVAELEHIIRAHPDQWLWLHRRWREADGAVFPR